MNASLQLFRKSSVPPFYKHLYVQVIVAVVVGIVLGYFYPNMGVQMKPLGDVFIRVTKMLITPVVFLTVATGIARMTDVKSLGGIFGKAMAYFSVFSILALVIGLIVANIVKPGAGMNIDLASLDVADISDNIGKEHFESLSHFLIDIIPETALKPFISGNILQTLFIAILFGVSLSLIGEKASLIKNFLEEMSFPTFKMISLVMRIAPLGAFGAMSYTVGKYGLSSISNLALLVGCLYLASAFFIFVILGLLARFCGFSILKLIRYLKEEIILVFSTSSSEAALPSLMAKMEKLGCHRSVVSIVVPTGYSFNLDGTNIYITLAALFIAQATNISLSVQDQLSLLLIAIVSSKGAAGVSGSGFVTLAATLSIFPALPIGGMALILGVDRFMSECRSITNVIGNAVATLIVCLWENKLEKNDFHKNIGT